MILSMTGFGSASFRVAEAAFAIEVRSVNHRHLDVRVKLPRALAGLEHELKAQIQERFERGKLDCTIVSPSGEAPVPRLEIDRTAVDAYLDAARSLVADQGVPDTLGTAQLLGLPGVARLVEPELPEDALRGALRAALDTALAALAAMRAEEGQALARDFEARLSRLEELAAGIEARTGEIQQSVRERLRRRARQLENEVGVLDEARLYQEISLAADRLDVTEELVRLRSHCEQFRRTLAAAGPGRPVGRRLDFLLQEMSREANTIGAKGADASAAHVVVEVKTELERMREQVQNVE